MRLKIHWVICSKISWIIFQPSITSFSLAALDAPAIRMKNLPLKTLPVKWTRESLLIDWCNLSFSSFVPYEIFKFKQMWSFFFIAIIYFCSTTNQTHLCRCDDFKSFVLHHQLFQNFCNVAGLKLSFTKMHYFKNAVIHLTFLMWACKPLTPNARITNQSFSERNLRPNGICQF